MALVHLDFESQYCAFNQDVYIILPDRPRRIDAASFYSSGKKYKVLWLLHGTFGGYSDWIRKSNIETYACEHDLIVVMPGVMNSDYEPWNNLANGYDSCKYIIDELMPLVHNWFPASDKREDNFIAGLSMGGGGTIKLALAYPEKFAAAASLSSAPWFYDDRKEELEEIFAKDRKYYLESDDEQTRRNLRLYNQMHRYDSVEEFLDSPSNTSRTLDRMADDPRLPRLFFSIGTEDPGYERFEKFRRHAEEIGLKVEFHTGPGVHEWRVWERDIQLALKFFGIDGDIKGNLF